MARPRAIPRAQRPRTRLSASGPRLLAHMGGQATGRKTGRPSEACCGARERRATIAAPFGARVPCRSRCRPASAPCHGWRKRSMSQPVIGFRELLERVLPLDRLPSSDRMRVQQALRVGLLHEVEAAALMAMERLEDQGALRRIPSSASTEVNVVRYLPADSRDVITIERPAPRDEEGILVISRATLPGRAPADLSQVRRLLRLEGIGILSDP